MGKVIIEVPKGIAFSPVNQQKTKEQGEWDLLMAVNTARKEGVYLFEPVEQTWFDLTYDSTGNVDESFRHTYKILSFPYRLEDLTKASHYNFHVKQYESSLFNSVYGDIPDPRVYKILEHLAALHAVFPSPNYIKTYADAVQKNPNASIDFNVVSSYGILTLEFNSADKVRDSMNKYMNSWDLKSGEIVTIAVQSIKADKMKDATISNAIDYLNNKMHDIFTMKFRQANSIKNI
jgi:hypothetical protein